MLPLTDGQRTFLENATERWWAVKLEICRLSDGVVQKTILTTADDFLDGEQLAIVGGSVRVDTNSDVLRSLSLELVDPHHELTLGVAGTALGLDKLLKVYKGYRIDAPYGAGETVLWPLGVFVLSGRPEIDATGGKRIVRLQAGDKACLANASPRGGFTTRFRVTQGTGKKAGIKAIAETWGETQFNLTPDSTATAPNDQPFEMRSSQWAAAQKLNSIVEPGDKITRLFYDPHGRLTLMVDPGPNLNNLPAVWTAKPSSSGISQLVGAKLVTDVLEYRNGSCVRFGGSLVTPGVVADYDTDANSPTSVSKIGYLVEDWKGGQEDDLIRNADEALARARFQRKQRQSYQERVQLTLLEQPALEPWDVIYVQEGQADTDGNYQLLSFTIDLGASGRMDAEGWRVRRLD